jgi:T5orf172 domain.
LDYRLQNSTAGYVYIISNIGSFGENVVKIGVTRRLEPMDRIDELGSASVPFKFDVHALIFSYDAYKLETELHEKFADKRINKVNNRKEYFNLTITEVEQALKEYKDLTIDFHEEPEAGEYRESLKISELNNA